ncbi:hypothetical protein BH10BAC2_BH10BAC2_32210 [soil metagenome]
MKSILLLLLGNFFNSNEFYKRHIQICSSTYAIDKKWNLNLKDNNSFTYTIETIDSKLNKNNKQEVLWANG